MATATFGISLAGCGSEDEDELGFENTLGGGNQSQTFTSSKAGGHSHQIFVNCAALAGAQGFTLQTSAAGGHIHMITLTNQHLAALRQGQSVKVNTTNAGGHTHQFLVNAC
jgi:hypothetical protein